MYFLTDICFMCLKNNIKLQSVFIQDNDGIVFIEKLRCCFPEIINVTPDAHKLACTECLEKLRFLYDFKQSGIRNNTVVSNYRGKLQCENKTSQQSSVVFPARKRRINVSSTENKGGNSFIMKIKNVNLDFTNGELNKIDHSHQAMATEKGNLETENIEKVCPVTDTETIYIKQEPQFSEDDSTTSYLDKEAEDSEGSNSSNEDDYEMVEERTSRPNNDNNQIVNAILNTLKPCYVSDDSVKFCNTCQELLFKDLNNINLHLHSHIQSFNCSRCEDSLTDIYKFQRHMFSHCEPMVEMLDKGEHGEKFSCGICNQQFDEFRSLKKHILDNHIRSLKCVVCSTTFTQKVNALRHILRKHCNVKPYKCKICPTRLVCKEGIKEHMIYEHYSCSICKFCQLTFKNPKAFLEHISKFHGEDLRQEEDTTANYAIGKDFSNFAMDEESNSRTSNSYNLKESIGLSVIHNATAIIEASYCEPGASVDQSNVCDICHKMFLYLSNLSEHLNIHMQVSRCFMCVDSAENISRLQRHMLTPCGSTTDPQDNDKVKCVICQQEFTFNILKKHMMQTHIKNLACVICNKSFAMKHNLLRHLLHHCELKPLQCEICGKTYTTKESLKYHVNSKHSSKVALCQYCQKRLQCPKTLSDHIKTMHPEFTYQCEVCKKNFLRKKDLGKHAKVHSRN